MKQLIIRGGIFSLALATILFACKKEIVTNSISDNGFKSFASVDTVGHLKTYYFLDNKEVDKTEVDYELKLEGNFVHIDLKRDSIYGDTLINFYFFSSKEKYIHYGNKNNIALGKILEFDDVMEAYADSSFVRDSFASNGIVPNWYFNYAESKLNEIFGINSSNKSLNTILHKDYLAGPNWHVLLMAPVMMWGWNDEVSAFTPIGLHGVTVLYDKMFFSKPLATITSWGFHRVQLYWGGLIYLNDRTSSLLCF